MKTTDPYPRINSVVPQSGHRLLVQFENGRLKLYDCTPLLNLEAFSPLNDHALFQCAHADPHGYGVIWNDDIDLAESEIWLNGQDVEQVEPSDSGESPVRNPRQLPGAAAL